MNTPVHVLMTGAGAPGAAGIIKCLLQYPALKLTVADADENAVGRYLHSPFISIPVATDKNFIESLLTVCSREKVDVILPLVTNELFPLSEHRYRFGERETRVLVSSANAIKIANDKAACFQFLHKNGIRIPKFFVAKTVEEFIRAANELGHPQQPFCFKPCIANGSRGFRIVWNSINESEQLFQCKPYNTNITYTHALKILSSYPFPPLLVTEFLPGEEYSVDCLTDRGKTVLAVPRLREKMVNGISTKGRFVYDSEIIRYCTQIIETIGLHGNIGLQVKRSEVGNPLLLEINPRVQGTIVAALGAGVNLPLLAIKQELGMAIQPEEMAVKWNTGFSRYWTELFY